MFEKMKSVYFLATLCFSTSISFAAWDGSAVTPPVSDSTISLYNSPTTVPIYHISTPEQLAGLAEVVNTVDSSGTDPWKGYYFAVLENDIVLGDDTSSVSDQPWIPIGVAEGLASIMYFDGNGHTIYGLNLTGVADSVFGLFGFLRNGELKNLTIANFNASIAVDSSFWAGDFYGGSLVGRAEYSHIHNVHSRGGTMHVEVLPKTTLRDSTNTKYYIGVDDVYVGGIVGSLEGSIDSSSNTSDIVVTFENYQSVGGIAGDVSRKYENSVDSIYDCFNSGNVASRHSRPYQEFRTGGIVGRTYLTIVHCQNTGTVSADDGKTGGIVGSGDGTGKVHFCENSGTVSNKRWYAGGIAGYGSTVSRSMNKGRVEGIFAGGIIGNAGSVTLCINEGFVKGRVVGGISGMTDRNLSQVINRGTLEGDTVGGICGRNLGVISSSYSYTSNSSATDVIGGLAGVSQGRIVSSAFDSTLQRSVELVGAALEGHGVIESFALSTKEMQSVEFADKLNEANREEAMARGYNNALDEPRLTWSVDGGYPIYSDSAHLPVYRIDLDDSVFVSYALTDAQGHIVDLPPAYSSKDRYFDVWVDSTGKTVTTSTVFKAPSTIYAKYSKTIKDPSLVVYRPDPTEIGWKGEMSIPTLRMHLDTSLYVAIFTPSELAWYLSTGAAYTKRAVLVNDIVMGKDTLSLLDRELGTLSRYRGFNEGFVFHGNGHKIYGLNHYLFELNNGGTIRDVHLVNSLLSYRGGAFAKTNRGEIISSSLRGAVVDTAAGLTSLGGFVSENYGGLIDSCVNYSDYDLDGVSIAGIAVDNYGTISNTRNLGNMKQSKGGSVAGIVTANRESGVIENCTNEGNIEYAGGRTILAGISVNNYDGSLISKSKNLGRIYARLDSFSVTWEYYPSALVAGIAGDRGDIDSCANLGEITVVAGDQLGGGVSLGGVSGGQSIRANVRNSLNQGAVTFVDSSSLVMENVALGGIAGRANVYSSRNEADVKWVHADSSKDLRGTKNIAVGGIVGYTHFVDNCVNDGNVVGHGYVGGVAASAGGIALDPSDTLARVANRGRVDAYGVGWWSITYAGGICGQCVYVEKALNYGSVSAKTLNDSSRTYMGGIAGYGGGAYMVANTAPVQGQGQGSNVVAGGLFGYFASLGVGLSDAYNWGEVSADSLAGGIWGMYEMDLLVKDDAFYSDLNEYVRNIYNAAPVNASNGYPVVASLSCPDSVDTSFTALIYNDSAFSHERSCVGLKDFDNESNLVSIYVYTSPLSTKYMQSDAFVDLLNTSGNTTADRHVWKRSQTYPVFDEAALEMSVGSKPPESSSSSGTVSSSSSSKKVESSSSSAKPGSSSVKTESSSSSKAKSSSSKKTVASSSSNKAASSSSKKSGKSSSSKGKSDVLPTVASAGMNVHFAGNDLVVTVPRSSRVLVEVFDMLGNSRGNFRAYVSASHVFPLHYLEQGRYLIRVNSGNSVRNLNVLIK